MWKKAAVTLALAACATSAVSAAPKGAAAGWTPPGLAKKGAGFMPQGLANLGKTPKGWGPRAEPAATAVPTPDANAVTEAVTGMPTSVLSMPAY